MLATLLRQNNLAHGDKLNLVMIRHHDNPESLTRRVVNLSPCLVEVLEWVRRP